MSREAASEPETLKAAPLTRLCRVTSVTRVGRRYRIGATFASSPAGFGAGWLGWLLDWFA